jgi:translation initiation factor 2D
VYLLSQPLLQPFLPLIQLHNPVPPPLFTGAPLFIPAVKNLRRPWLLPDVAEGTIVAFTTAANPAGSSSSTSHDGGGEEVVYLGIGRVAARGGMRGALELREKNMKDGQDRDEGRFCDILCIVGDQ